METTRRGFLATLVGTSLLGLLWPERLKSKSDLLPPPLEKPVEKPMPLPALADESVGVPTSNTDELMNEKPAPHEGAGSFCPFDGRLYTSQACPCLRCTFARAEYWRNLNEQAELIRQRSRWVYTPTTTETYPTTMGGYPMTATTGYLTSKAFWGTAGSTSIPMTHHSYIIGADELSEVPPRSGAYCEAKGPTIDTSQMTTT